MQHITNQIAHAFSRAAKTYDSAATLQHQVGSELINLLPRTQFTNILDAGCGTGYTTLKLTNQVHFNSLLVIDIAGDALSIAAKRLPEQKTVIECANLDTYRPMHKLDLIFSNMALQWCSNIKTVIKQLTSSLNPEGLIAFTLPLESSLAEIKSLATTNPLPTYNTIIHYLDELNLVTHFATYKSHIQTFPNQLNALRSIKQCGANYTITKSGRKLNHRLLVQPTPASLTYQIGYFIAEKYHA